MRTFLINIAVFLGLFATSYFAIPVIHTTNQFIRSLSRSPDARASRPNYAGVAWASTHFAEFGNLRSGYLSYLGWRRLPFSGATINIDPDMRIRRTPATGPSQTRQTVYFFGGSTVWGTGSDDLNTIPSLYQKAAGGKVLNFGESGWTAHQSLNQLIKLYTEGHRPDVVVFYDGYNDVRYKCRSGRDFWSHEREPRIQQAIAYAPREFGYYLQPILEVVNNFWKKDRMMSGKKQLAGDCDSDPRKADLVAEQLITAWRIAAALVTSHGGRFHAFLHPVAFLSTTRTDQIELAESVRAQFQTVYALIRQKIAGLPWASDLTLALDRDEYIYIDEVHVSPNGNALIVARMQGMLN